MSAETKIKTALSAASLGPMRSLSPLSSGDWASVYKVDLKSGQRLAAKIGHPGHEDLMASEAGMLDYLSKKSPNLFPAVAGEGEGVLLLEFVENDGVKAPNGAFEAGKALAGLHNISADDFGFEVDTVFGPSRQPNPKTRDWIEFYGRHRLLYMGRIAREAGRISPGVYDSLKKLVSELGNFLPARPEASLLHGDFWGGNLLFHKGRLGAFIDPAIYYGDQEVDLAFSTLFGSLGEDFFNAYREIRSIEPGFRERIDIYNLWGLLFHAYWFGGGYAASVRGILNRFGY